VQSTQWWPCNGRKLTPLYNSSSTSFSIFSLLSQTISLNGQCCICISISLRQFPIVSKQSIYHNHHFDEAWQDIHLCWKQVKCHLYSVEIKPIDVHDCPLSHCAWNAWKISMFKEMYIIVELGSRDFMTKGTSCAGISIWYNSIQTVPVTPFKLLSSYLPLYICVSAGQFPDLLYSRDIHWCYRISIDT